MPRRNEDDTIISTDLWGPRRYNTNTELILLQAKVDHLGSLNDFKIQILLSKNITSNVVGKKIHAWIFF
jgi:hypothetical protein